MARAVWQCDLADGQHTIALRHCLWDGHWTLAVDSEVVARGGNISENFGATAPFQIDDTPAELRIAYRWPRVGYSYDCVLQGRSLTGDRPARPFYAAPRWGWIFPAAWTCFALAALTGFGAASVASSTSATLGGALCFIGAAIGIACTRVLAASSIPTSTRSLLASAVSALGIVLGVLAIVRAVAGA